jgi:hypothetical protein
MPPRQKKAADPAAELAERLLRVLQAQRSLGGSAYPLRLHRLAELTDPLTPKSVILKAAGKKSFLQQVIVARAKELEAPLALAEDLSSLAASPLLLDFLLRQARTASNHLFSPADLRKKATSKLQKAFGEALTRQLDEGTLGPGVGWIMNRSKKLFLLQDMHTSRPAAPPQPAPSAPPPPPVSQALPADGTAVLDFEPAFAAAFERLDRDQGGPNFVSLVQLRQALPVPRAAFDEELQKLRRAGRYRLAAAEGRHGISAAEQEAGILEDGALLLFVSRNR